MDYHKWKDIVATKIFVANVIGIKSEEKNPAHPPKQIFSFKITKVKIAPQIRIFSNTLRIGNGNHLNY